MELKKVSIEQIIPYESNPRHNDNAVDAVAESIRQCGYCAPIVVDEDMVVLAGHTRLKALKQLGWAGVSVCVVSGLTSDQKRKYRLLDNKTNELASWDFERLEKELEGLDFEGFDFEFEEIKNKTEDIAENEAKLQENWQIIIDCIDEIDMQDKYETLQGLDIECRISTL